MTMRPCGCVQPSDEVFGASLAERMVSCFFSHRPFDSSSIASIRRKSHAFSLEKKKSWRCFPKHIDKHESEGSSITEENNSLLEKAQKHSIIIDKNVFRTILIQCNVFVFSSFWGRYGLCVYVGGVLLPLWNIIEPIVFSIKPRNHRTQKLLIWNSCE